MDHRQPLRPPRPAFFRRPARRSGLRLLPSLSVPLVVLALGAALATLGLTAGLWLCLVGGEIALFGAVWLGRELREERRWGR